MNSKIRVLTVLLLMGALAAAVPVQAGQKFKGGYSSVLTDWTFLPNIDECGPYPPFVEISYSAPGADTLGGPFTAHYRMCLNMATGERFNDHGEFVYLTGDTMTAHCEPWTQWVDEETCLLTNPDTIECEISGGTGELEGIAGFFSSDLTASDTSCLGESRRFVVWWHGHARFPQGN